jgi:hypothetical protein
MFQRLKGSLDRVIAEEQARQKAANEQAASGSTGGSPRQSSSVSRSNSGASTARKTRPKKQSQDVSKNDDGAANLDPAVFEAAFVIDDDEPSRANTPKPPSDEQAQNGDDKVAGSANDEAGASSKAEGNAHPSKDAEARTKHDDEQKPAPPPKNDPHELPPDIRTKLRKLEKLEATYPGWLISRREVVSQTSDITCPAEADLLRQSCCAPTALPTAEPLPSSLSNAPSARTPL